jgi:hypothetical protein
MDKLALTEDGLRMIWRAEWIEEYFSCICICISYLLYPTYLTFKSHQIEIRIHFDTYISFSQFPPVNTLALLFCPQKFPFLLFQLIPVITKPPASVEESRPVLTGLVLKPVTKFRHKG